MRNIDDKNLDAEIILGRHESRALKELIPFYEWPKPLEDGAKTMELLYEHSAQCQATDKEELTLP